MVGVNVDEARQEVVAAEIDRGGTGAARFQRGDPAILYHDRAFEDLVGEYDLRIGYHEGFGVDALARFAILKGLDQHRTSSSAGAGEGSEEDSDRALACECA